VQLADASQAKAGRLQALTHEIQLLDQDSSAHQQELMRVKEQSMPWRSNRPPRRIT